MTVSTAYDPSNPIRVTVSGGVGPAGAAGAAGAVFSVNGLTGTITLSSINVSAASAVHSHAAGDITSGTLDAARLPIATATAVGIVSVTSGLSVTAGGALSANVRSVAGRTGDVTLTLADVTAAAASHQHAASDITSGTLDAARLPTISYTSLSNVPATFTPATHTHDASAIQAGTMATARLPIATATAVGVVSVTSGLSVTAGGALSANVRSVAGRTGDVTLSGGDVSGVVTTLNSLSGAVAIAAGSNITVSSGGTTVTIASTGGGGSPGGVTSVAGVTGSVTITAFGLATSTSGQAVVFDARPVRTTPAAITASQNDYNPGAGDIFRISSGSTSTLSITGLATASMSQEALFVNVSTHTSAIIRFQHQNTNSIAAQRIISPWAGDVNLAPNGGSAVVVYDQTDSRWRVV